MKKWKYKLHEIIFEANTIAGKLFDTKLYITILLSVPFVSLGSVSYRDIYTHSPQGQFFASFIVIMGYDIIAVTTGIVTTKRYKKKSINTNTQACPHSLNPYHKEYVIFYHQCGKILNKCHVKH